MSGDLSGRVALVTGATRTAGIGAAICRALAARGADVAFAYWVPHDRNTYPRVEGDPDLLCRELRGLGVRAEGLQADLSRPDTPAWVLGETNRLLGPPSILVNNAAYSTRDGFESLDAHTLDAHYAVNVRATALLSVHFARGYSGGAGRIISLTSGQSLGPMLGELAYAASKGAVEALTRTLAAEVAAKNITVNAVNPGPTDTGWMSEALQERLAAKFPGGRVGEPEDAARLVAFLASDEAAWITGQIIHSDGGFLRS